MSCYSNVSSKALSYRGAGFRSTLALAFLTTFALSLTVGVGVAIASKQVVGYIGIKSPSGTLGGQFNDPNGVAVNNTGAGPADQGDIYVADGENNRVQRIGHDDHGTPADSTDDAYFFISAWGAGVDSTTDDNGYEVCTVASDCQAGVESVGGGGFTSYYPGDGRGVRYASGVAVDQDTGDVYVVDTGNIRVNVYTGDGLFLRAFGFDVVASGPDENGTGYEVCIAANGDVCKAGLTGSGAGQLTNLARGIAVSQPDESSAGGTVFVADGGNHRIGTYNLDGTSPSSFGSGVFSSGGSWDVPSEVAVDGRGIVYSSNISGPLGTDEIVRYDSENVNGNGVGFLAPIKGKAIAFDVDRDEDGAGPDTEVLYALQRTPGTSVTWVSQYGPLNVAGLTAPPAAADDEHGKLYNLAFGAGLAFEKSTGRLFVSATGVGGAGPDGVYVLDDAGPPPTASFDSLSDITSTGVTAHATIDPNGPPALSYRFEYSLDGNGWLSTPTTILGAQQDPQSINDLIEPGGGLQPNTLYYVRMVAARPFVDPIVSPQRTFTTLPAAPIAETVGSPQRTTTTARLDARVSPNGSNTTYYFEYGDQGSCDANPCTSTELLSAGAGQETKLVAQRLSGLAPGTTYHYRVVADNGVPSASAMGGDRTVTTRISDAPLSHGRLPGPTGSDRAWEQVNMPDTGGNPVSFSMGFSADGNRALYRISGGTPDSNTGSLFGIFFAERSVSGWKSKQITPARSEQLGANWEFTVGSDDLSTMASANTEYTKDEAAIWRFDPVGQPVKLYQRVAPQEFRGRIGISTDGTRIIALISGTVDPNYPQGNTTENLYDLSSGTPHLVNLLPDGSAPSCGVGEVSLQPTHWISADGSRIFFSSCSGVPALYMREMEAGKTKLVSGSPSSGSQCASTFIRATSSAAFFSTSTRLAANDTDPPLNCNSNGDVYRYDLSNGALRCVTCVVLHGDANVRASTVSEDGSRIYFLSSTRLLPGAPENGVSGTYRVDVDRDDLAYVGPLGLPMGGRDAITSDGSKILVRSDDLGLNQLGGQKNDGTEQFYLYNDEDRSLICVSCPEDGSAPTADVREDNSSGAIGYEGPNQTALSDNGIAAFSTPTPLVSIDQNTAGQGQDPDAGTDIYEWRDGRLFLVSDGLSNWEGGTSVPLVSGVSRNGRDIFFRAPAQYTPDAIDAYQRFYDARIGGGFEFPKPPPPCPLEVCQGTPKGQPEERTPGTGTFAGVDSVDDHRVSCRKGKVRRKGRCTTKNSARKNHRNRSNNNRRAAR